MININYLAQKIFEAYRKLDFTPIRNRFVDFQTKCCCPFTALYLSEKGLDASFEYDPFINFMKEQLGKDEMYVRTMMKGIDEVPEKMLGLKDDKEAYRLGCALRKIIFQET